MRLYTYTGVWTHITAWIERLASQARRIERQRAREREIAAAKERQRRDKSAAGFDERMRKRV